MHGPIASVCITKQTTFIVFHQFTDFPNSDIANYKGNKNTVHHLQGFCTDYPCIHLFVYFNELKRVDIQFKMLEYERKVLVFFCYQIVTLLGMEELVELETNQIALFQYIRPKIMIIDLGTTVVGEKKCLPHVLIWCWVCNTA